jgi:MFS family permease
MSSRRLITTFGLLTALSAAGYGVMFTALDDFRDHFGISGGQLSLVVASGFFTQFFAQLFLAPLADRGHARRLVALGMMANVVGLVVIAASSTLPLLVAGRLLSGVGAGMAVPAVRRIVILHDPDQLGKNLGRLLAADVAGFAMGPAISAVLIGPFGIPAPFLVIAAATVLCLPIIAKVHIDETVVEEGSRTKFAFDLLTVRPFLATVALGAAVFMMIGTFDALWALVLSDLNSSDLVSNLGITVFAVPLVLLGSIGGRLAQDRGPFRVGSIGLTLGAGFMFLYGHMPTGVAMLAVGVVHSLSDGLTVSSCGVAVGLVVPAERQAAAQGMLGGVQTLTAGITALVAGQLYERSGRVAAYTACSIAMVVCVAAAVALSGSAFRLRGTFSVADATA